MEKREERSVRARAFVLVSSSAASLVVWYGVVRAIGYSPLTGFFYFLGYFVAMLLFFNAFGYSLFDAGAE